MKFEEFRNKINQAIYVSATPADYELEKSEGIIVEQVVRPTGLLEPIIEVRSSKNQIDDLLEEIRIRIENRIYLKSHFLPYPPYIFYQKYHMCAVLLI